ncbi:MAG: NAD-dependent epimerase/dehydratase family protein [Pseudolysinimonas sp.]
MACLQTLVLGGGEFVGRYIVQELLAADHHVTVLNHGHSPLVPGAHRLIGDRFTTDGLGVLVGTEWDMVVDVSGYLRRQVAAVLASVTVRRRYLFVSSHAVYTLADVGPGANEDCPRRAPIDDPPWPLDNDTYGPAKVSCENALNDQLGNRSTVVRPGKVAGPHDNQPSLGHWVRAVLAGELIAVPDPKQPVQLVDVRDLAVLVRRLLDDDRPGAFQAVGQPLTIAAVLAECARGLGLDPDAVRLTAGDASASYPLLQADRPWSVRQRSNARAVAAGMPLTPLAVTVRDWWRSVPRDTTNATIRRAPHPQL